jgi:hypothetical protein
MNSYLTFVILTFMLSFIFAKSLSVANEINAEDPPDVSELDINGVMKYAMTQGLCRKVIKKKASKEEKQHLLALFKRLAELTPPVGTDESWKSFTKPMVDATKDIVDGKDAYRRLGKAANCTKCHRDHRPK